MTSSFENPLNSNPQLEQGFREDSYSAQKLFGEYDAITPTGNVIMDAQRFDAVSNEGRISATINSTEKALRTLVAVRDGIYSRPRALATDHALAALDRLLNYYGVTAKTLDEFDKQSNW